MDSNTSADTHPAFVRIIEQLSAEEVQILDATLKRPDIHQAIAEVVREQRNGERGRTTLHRHLMDLRNSETGAHEAVSRFPAMVDNWIRLGLVEVAYDKWLTRQNAYDWIEQRPEYQHLKAEHEDDEHTVTSNRGMFRLTSLGKQFAKVVTSHADRA